MVNKVKELKLEEKVLELSSTGHSLKEIADLLTAEGHPISGMSIDRFLLNSRNGKTELSISEEHLQELNQIIEIVERQVDKEIIAADYYRGGRKTPPVYAALRTLSALKAERAKLLARLKTAADSEPEAKQEAKA